MHANPCVRYVYAIELDAAADPKTRARILYVGQTGVTPRERFEAHKRGGMHASRIVTHYGRRLLPGTEGPFSSIEEAEAAEKSVAEDFRRRGFRVFGGH